MTIGEAYLALTVISTLMGLAFSWWFIRRMNREVDEE